ncbi:ketopantoate reductase family protein [Pseudoxanthomonas winnipegensis]|uniref:2-dehydropantoate 2-reductase n=1 Tax=Pseudoxanthomonas winnipegensis TaxID=2480810 RepID=A0A4Q8LK31_9GAMM|nr:2-dehydropantoate 2-reductase [Pseudoxanthomonas winnipegensis]RZZ82631.1 2-dehydropantoate 2-reductase [Pseudoxanthomonas winnipegensis]TAA30590.1 2-dehydropantoate 2-reductase [Pseudoxanthomonas winnipegensis]
MNPSATRIGIVGAGAIGAVVAGLLATAGAHVSVVELGARREAIAREGLRFRIGDAPAQSLALPVGDATDFGVQDIVFLAVKSHVLPSALAGAMPMIGPQTQVVPLVNGVPWWYFVGTQPPFARAHVETVDPGAKAQQLLRPEQLIGSVVYITAALTAQGLAYATGPQRLVIGEVLGGASARTQALVDLLERAGIATKLSSDIRRDVWTKVALNLATNPLSVVAEAHLADQFNRDDLRNAVDAVLHETVALAALYGVQPSMDLEQMIATGKRVGAFETSMLQDYRAGRPLELGAIGQAVLELAEQAGHAMPVARSMVGLANYKAQRAAAIVARDCP